MLVRLIAICLIIFCSSAEAAIVTSRIDENRFPKLTPAVTADSCTLSCTQDGTGTWTYEVPENNNLLTTIRIGIKEDLPPSLIFTPMKLEIPQHKQSDSFNIVITPVTQPRCLPRAVRTLYGTDLDPESISTDQLQTFFQTARAVSMERIAEHKNGSSGFEVYTMQSVYKLLQSYRQLDNRLHLNPEDETEIAEAAAWLEQAITEYPTVAADNLPRPAIINQLLDDVKYAKADQLRILWDTIANTEDTAKRHRLLLSYEKMVKESAGTYSEDIYYKRLGIDESHILSALANTMSTLILQGKYKGDSIPALQKHIDRMIYVSRKMQRNSTMCGMLRSDITTLENLKQYLLTRNMVSRKPAAATN
ncbi:hypothetical protein LN040_03430 [Desulfovibrio subterraneus]|uniref:hypothetical protein n=1 Tax=Desulfovibrio subterraneus TaxID=2718620 RepID=UPI0022B92058|nr:hypothetical protein [Desulfovibrio subterraneus]WBF68171.1 hypothetical protein LN040_03430 [Desulfovibrio subterraneus]